MTTATRSSGVADPLSRPPDARPWPGTLLIWLSAAVVVSPFLVRGPSCGSDFLFHFSAWHDALHSWRNAILYPHWASSANFGAGEPRFVFYPPLIWMLGAALGAVLPWVAVPIALNFLLLAAAGLATRALARQQLSPGAATLAGCTAIFSGYALYEVYFHGDFALLSGGFWVPVLLLLQLRAPTPARSSARQILDGSVCVLALAFAGTWLSNAPLGLMASYLLATLALLQAFQQRSWTPLLRTGIAIVLGFGLIGFYLVPAAAEQHWVDIQKLFASPEHLIQNRWITAELLGPPHHLFPSQRARGLIEVIMLLMALRGILTLWRKRWSLPDPSASIPGETATTEARHWWLALACVCGLIVLLLFPVSAPLWNLLPRLRYLEYPWRWMVVLQAPMAVFFAAGLWPQHPRWQRVTSFACAFLFLAATLATSSNRHMFAPCAASDAASGSGNNSIAAMNRMLRPGGLGVVGSEEYATPPGARNDLIATGMPDACLLRDPSTLLSMVPAQHTVGYYTPRVWSPALGTCTTSFAWTFPGSDPEHKRLAAQIPTSGYLVLHLRSYPAWTLTLNGHMLHGLPQRPDGLIVLPVQPGPAVINVDWTSTPDVLLGRCLSAASLILLCFLCWLERVRPARSPSSVRHP